MSSLPPKPGMKGPPGALQDPRAQEEAERQDRHRNEDLGDACAKIEEELEALKARFEMYFLGIERREPARERQEMKRRVAHLKNQFTRNTGLRFRIQTLHARFLSYERMWLRSAREKEEGTYRRDILKARRHAQLEERKQAEKAQEAAAARGATTAPEAKPSPPPPAPVGGMSEAQLRSIYDAYVSAKKRCNEDVSRLSYEALAKTIAKQVPELLSKYGAKSVEFKVVIKDGRAVLKAVPRV
ncbi:MAG TPA: MXAN_5187 C-terminal domain-containing protein [Anaeromyxobacteraceae bacterium]